MSFILNDFYAESHYAECLLCKGQKSIMQCRYAECHYAECRGAVHGTCTVKLLVC
jgi:hypothetical protein